VPPTADGPNEFLRPLTAQGHEQALALAPDLVRQRPTRFVSSPYRRAVDTVAPAAAAMALTIELDAELREWESGLPSTPDWEVAYRAAWENEGPAVGSGESHVELQRRALRAFEAHVEPAGARDVIVLASHGTWISRLLAALGCKIDADFWLAMPMPAVYSVTGSGRVVRGPGLHG
jgi:2,3-bisphosphoglycerate-dependent phosphoglycerate mutase